MTRKLWWLPLTSLALICLAGPSTAGDGEGIGWDYKTLPGAACQPQIGAQAGDFERQPDYLINVSKDPEARTVICPIVRDTVHERDLDIGVTVTEGVRCSFFRMNFKATQIVNFNPTEIQDLGDGRIINYFLVKADPNVDPEGFVGYYALQCALPTDGQLFSYGSGELAETTDHGE